MTHPSGPPPEKPAYLLQEADRPARSRRRPEISAPIHPNMGKMEKGPGLGTISRPSFLFRVCP